MRELRPCLWHSKGLTRSRSNRALRPERLLVGEQRDDHPKAGSRSAFERSRRASSTTN
jgi:hypothetical protein